MLLDLHDKGFLTISGERWKGSKCKHLCQSRREEEQAQQSFFSERQKKNRKAEEEESLVGRRKG